jgi:tRNA G18 (ribose-2'-O)-methylase SpoU
MPHFEHVRHQPPRELSRQRELVIACAPMRSNVNLSRIVRAAGCCGVQKIICCGTAKVVDKIARDGADEVDVEVHRTLLPALKKLKTAGYELVGLEQTTGSEDLHTAQLTRQMVLVVGNERSGLTDEILAVLDRVVEIPVWGLPYSYNAATSACMALYEYCRQYPDG